MAGPSRRVGIWVERVGRRRFSELREPALFFDRYLMRGRDRSRRARSDHGTIAYYRSQDRRRRNQPTMGPRGGPKPQPTASASSPSSSSAAARCSNRSCIRLPSSPSLAKRSPKDACSTARRRPASAEHPFRSTRRHDGAVARCLKSSIEPSRKPFSRRCPARGPASIARIDRCAGRTPRREPTKRITNEAAIPRRSTISSSSGGARESAGSSPRRCDSRRRCGTRPHSYGARREPRRRSSRGHWQDHRAGPSHGRRARARDGRGKDRGRYVHRQGGRRAQAPSARGPRGRAHGAGRGVVAPTWSARSPIWRKRASAPFTDFAPISFARGRWRRVSIRASRR